MIPKAYQYIDVDGNHWPDASVGDSLYYSVDFAQWVVAENDNLVSVDWVVPECLNNEDSFVEGGQAFIKLGAAAVGSYKVLCNIHTVENTKEQTKTIPMILKVY